VTISTEFEKKCMKEEKVQTEYWFGNVKTTLERDGVTEQGTAT
jgi:hypothetical protein